MVRHGTIPMSDAEQATFDRLVEEHGQVGITRRDLNNEGPLLVQVKDHIWLVAEDGCLKELSNG